MKRLVLGVGALILVAACRNGGTSATPARPTPFDKVSSIADGERATRDVVDTTAARFLKDKLLEDNGLGVHGCDTPNRYLYDYGIAAPFQTAEEASALFDEIWRFWQDEYGFRDPEGPTDGWPRTVRAQAQGFRGALTANLAKLTLFAEVSSPCFER
jgi:hypothetical protein